MSVKTASVTLESGDHLSQEDFHRRYCLRPDIKKAELIQGVVYVGSPVRHTFHGEPHALIMTWLGVYTSLTTGVHIGDNATVFLGRDSEVQPDAYLFRVPAPNPAAAHLTEKGYIEGAPQLVVEVAASSVSIDLHQKLEVYQQAGVPEYVVWRTEDEALDWFRLRDGRYERVEPDEQGAIESAAFPGLRLHVPKLLAGDAAGVLAELRAPAAGA